MPYLRKTGPSSPRAHASASSRMRSFCSAVNVRRERFGGRDSTASAAVGRLASGGVTARSWPARALSASESDDDERGMRKPESSCALETDDSAAKVSHVTLVLRARCCRHCAYALFHQLPASGLGASSWTTGAQRLPTKRRDRGKTAVPWWRRRESNHLRGIGNTRAEAHT
jgi:hypothetical protein